MSCVHKFRKYLELNTIDFEPATLIIGTFNPQWPDGNDAEWFYGRTDENFFWDILPRIYDQSSMLHDGKEKWQQFCRTNKIALTDLITSIDDANEQSKKHNKVLGGFSDKAIVYNFDDFTFTNIIGILQKHSSIKNVYLTRGVTESFWKHLWNPIVHYCNVHDLHQRILLTPTATDLYQHEAYNNDNPDMPIPLVQDYLLMRWKQEWHF